MSWVRFRGAFRGFEKLEPFLSKLWKYLISNPSTPAGQRGSGTQTLHVDGPLSGRRIV
jgi:hypothetical protein